MCSGTLGGAKLNARVAVEVLPEHPSVTAPSRSIGHSDETAVVSGTSINVDISAVAIQVNEPECLQLEQGTWLPVTCVGWFLV